MDEKRRFGRVALPSAHEWGFTKWLYLPTLGWELIERGASDTDLASAHAIRLNRDQLPDIVPLETLAGRDHYRFAGRERPPWRGRVADRVP